MAQKQPPPNHPEIRRSSGNLKTPICFLPFLGEILPETPPNRAVNDNNNTTANQMKPLPEKHNEISSTSPPPPLKQPHCSPSQPTRLTQPFPTPKPPKDHNFPLFSLDPPNRPSNSAAQITLLPSSLLDFHLFCRISREPASSKLRLQLRRDSIIGGNEPDLTNK
ncbi:hypothetical protein AABB24_033758 [Solanum stoloniferum]|uniref:Uncharacterized protein n=2 Tax=Solanum stoloniferum TaxID=62892 RepID=A0ABD2RCN6_9SOLN